MHPGTDVMILVVVMDRNRSLRNSAVALGIWRSSGQLEGWLTADNEVEADWVGKLRLATCDGHRRSSKLREVLAADKD